MNPTTETINPFVCLSLLKNFILNFYRERKLVLFRLYLVFCKQCTTIDYKAEECVVMAKRRYATVT